MTPFHFSIHSVNTCKFAQGVLSGLGTYPTTRSARELMVPEIAPTSLLPGWGFLESQVTLSYGFFVLGPSSLPHQHWALQISSTIFSSFTSGLHLLCNHWPKALINPLTLVTTKWTALLIGEAENIFHHLILVVFLQVSAATNESAQPLPPGSWRNQHGSEWMFWTGVHRSRMKTGFTCVLFIEG